MWPYTQEDLARFNRIAADSRSAPAPGYSTEAADYYIARAHRLRALMLGIAARRLYERLLNWLGRPMPSEAAASQADDEFITVVTDRLKAPLTSIRSSSEILRDHPDLPLEKRKQFIDAVLQENARLETLIGRILDVSRFEPGRRSWRIDASDIAAYLHGKGVSHGTSG